MIFFLVHFLSGYCLVALSGNGQERFLNICASKEILLWHLSRRENHYMFYVSRKAFREMENIAAKSGCSYQCLEKKGLPYFFYRYRGRKCLAAAVLGGAIFLYVMSLFIWQIEPVGCYSHSKEELMDYLEKKGIRCGMRISELSCAKLEEEIREDFADISWVSCERRGTLLKVAVKETLHSTEGDKTNIPCNLIAAKEGIIDSIVVRSGTAKVKKGDKVKPGDILISGIVELYDDSGTVTEKAKVSASGDVYAITKVKYEDSFELLQPRKKYTGKKKYQYQLILSGRIFSLPFDGSQVKGWDQNSTQHMLHIGSELYLPVSIVKTTYSQCTIHQKKWNKTEAKRQAEQRLTLFLAEYEAKGVEILKNNVTINCNINVCRTKGTIWMKERFGKVQKI